MIIQADNLLTEFQPRIMGVIAHWHFLDNNTLEDLLQKINDEFEKYYEDVYKKAQKSD